MSDIGQPLWFASHLDLLDVDGLTDKYLAHAPSVRGDLPSVDTHLAEILREPGFRNATGGQRAVARRRAQRRDFEAHLARNADYVLVEKEADYLLLFLQYRDAGASGRGAPFPYPKISAVVYHHPRRAADYLQAAALPKAAQVENTIFRRRGLAADLPDWIKAERLRRTFERNPRLHYLAALAYGTALGMTDSEARQETLALVDERLSAAAHNQRAVNEMIHLASQAGDAAMLARLRAILDAQDKPSPWLWRRSAELAWQMGRREEAIAHQRRAADAAAPDDNTQHYPLARFYLTAGHLDQALATCREAITRVPDDPRPWSDLATFAERASFESGRTPAERQRLQRIALEGFEGLARAQDPPTPEVLEHAARLRAVLGATEGAP